MTDEERERLLDHWEGAARGWGRQADRMRDAALPVSEAMLASVPLAPGVRVAELAAGPGDLSLLAAPRVAPTNVLCSDGVQAMVDVARDRAEDAGITNIVFERLNLEWIDLPTGSVDVVLCRYGVMLCVDPEAALRECRRVLAPGGHIAIAVQAPEAENPWVTVPAQVAAVEGLYTPAPIGTNGPFSLADPDRLAGLIAGAGFFDVAINTVDFAWRFTDELDWVGEKLDHSPTFAAMWRELRDAERAQLRGALRDRAAEYTQPDGSLRVPGRALVAAASA